MVSRLHPLASLFQEGTIRLAVRSKSNIFPPSFPSVIAAAKKTAAPTSSSRSSAAIDKWEKEVRESAAAKKKAASNGLLSKADQALVNTQLALESDVRKKIALVKAQMERGLAFVKSLVAAETELFKAQLTDTLQMILDGPLDKGSFLVGEEAFKTFLVSPAPLFILSRSRAIAQYLCAASTGTWKLLFEPTRASSTLRWCRHPSKLRHLLHPRAPQRRASIQYEHLLFLHAS
jgi:hypothetical protein